MNRRFVVPFTFMVLMLSFALIALPAKGSSKANNQVGVTLKDTPEPTEAADACSLDHNVPGVILSDMFLLDTPDKSGLPLIKVTKTDIVEVLGRNKTGFWVAVQSNFGIVGWATSPQVQIDKKQWGDIKLIPVIDTLPESDTTATDNSGDNSASATDEATDEAQATEDPFANCPTLEAIVSATRFALQVKPLTRSGDVGKTVINGEKVTILALNPSGSWALVQADTGEIGWITTSYTVVQGGSARLSRVRKDYTVVEATLTPNP